MAVAAVMGPREGFDSVEHPSPGRALSYHMIGCDLYSSVAVDKYAGLVVWCVLFENSLLLRAL